MYNYNRKFDVIKRIVYYGLGKRLKQDCGVFTFMHWFLLCVLWSFMYLFYFSDSSWTMRPSSQSLQPISICLYFLQAENLQVNMSFMCATNEVKSWLSCFVCWSQRVIMRQARTVGLSGIALTLNLVVDIGKASPRTFMVLILVYVFCHRHCATAFGRLWIIHHPEGAMMQLKWRHYLG